MRVTKVQGRYDMVGGLPNQYWWCDKANGIAGILGTHMLPWYDSQTIKLWGGILDDVYIK